MPRRNLLDNDGLPLPDMPTTDEAQAEVRRRETPINHGTAIHEAMGPHVCACGAQLHRNISIREGRCQACRNLDTRKVEGYGR